MASINLEPSELSGDKTTIETEASNFNEEQTSNDNVKQENLNNGDHRPTDDDNNDDDDNDDDHNDGNVSDQKKAVVVKNSNDANNDNVDDSIRSNDSNNNDVQNDSSDDNDKTNLIVNYLPQHMTDEEFEDLFKKFGAMKSCKIVRNRSTGYSYGFGFVDFETHEQAMQAINELNGHELENKKIKVAFARPAGQDIKQANLYVKNVPNTWTSEDVRRVFEPYGNIIQVRVLGNNRGVAFVLYDLRKQAEDALEAMNGKKLDECEAPFEIKFAADKKVEGKSGGSVSGNSAANKGNNQGGTGGRGNRRERGNRGGRNRNRDSSKQRGGGQRQGNQSRGGGGSFFDRQREERRGGGGQSHFNNSNNNSNNMNNGFGPVRQQTNRANRYAPFVPVQQHPTAQQPMTGATMAPQLAPAPAYGYPGQQPMMPTYMLTSGQPAAMMQPTMMHPTMAQQAAGQQAMQMNPFGAYQQIQPGAYAPVTQNAMNNIYSVASNTMQNAAQMQPQLGQPMSMRQQQPMGGHQNHSGGGSSGGHGDDGVTLFVYNIGPQSDEDELRQMFSPYGQVVKCNVVRKSPGGETKGFGFVTLKTRDQATSAIAGLNGSMKNGRTLQVSLKK